MIQWINRGGRPGAPSRRGPGPSSVRAVPAPRFVLDGEIVVPVEETFSFDDLLQRIHPAESRVRKLSAERPALCLVFDLLADEKGRSLLEEPWRTRRAALERFAAKRLSPGGRIRLSPATGDPAAERRWVRGAGGALDGVIAKLAPTYHSGDRTAMRKVKFLRTAEAREARAPVPPVRLQ